MSTLANAEKEAQSELKKKQASGSKAMAAVRPATSSFAPNTERRSGRDPGVGSSSTHSSPSALFWECLSLVRKH